MVLKGETKADSVARLRALPEVLDELVARPQWVVWRYEQRDGKATKVPYDPVRRRLASTTDQRTWCTFEEAVVAFEGSDQLDGIGFVFSPEDPYSGVDLDDCLDDEGRPHPWAQQILDELQTYTEISPSGRGVKLFLEGKIPSGRRRKGKVEMYDSGRYFTVTGQHLTGTPLWVEKRQEEIESLHRRIFARDSTAQSASSKGSVKTLDRDDLKLLDRARAAKNGEKFRALFDHGDLSGHGGDDSRADLALCSLLAFWCQGEAERIDRLFRSSQLMRTKWDSRRGDSTYGARTIERAVELVGDVDAPSGVSVGRDSDSKPTQAQLLIELAADLDLFHTPDGAGYATLPIGGHVETWPLRSSALRRLLVRRFFEVHDKQPGSQALQDALLLLEAQAQFDGPEIPVYLRVGEQDGCIYLDLADADWRCAEVSSKGWRVLETSPVKFGRTGGMQPLPAPVSGGSLEELRKLINLPDDESFILYCSFLVVSLRPCGPYPALTIQGEQGSAKSTAARVAKELIDPSAAPLRTAPRDERDLMITAGNSWLLAYDNLSRLPSWLSDALCRLATGGGFSTRQLFSDDLERIFSAMRPSVLNGIEDVATRPDLLDRCLVLTLKAIPDTERRTAAEVSQAFEEARPRLLGALLDAVSCGLRRQDEVKLTCRPRMADFATWVSAAEPSLPWAEGAFLEAYFGNRSEAVEVALEADVLAVAVQSFIASTQSFEGTATELLEGLEEEVGERSRLARSWPKSARALSGRLRRAATVLRSVGIEVSFHRSSDRAHRRLIVLEKSRNFASEPSRRLASASQPADTEGVYTQDAGWTQRSIEDANGPPSDTNDPAMDANRTQPQKAGNQPSTGVSDVPDGKDANSPAKSNSDEEWVL